MLLFNNIPCINIKCGIEYNMVWKLNKYIVKIDSKGNIFSI